MRRVNKERVSQKVLVILDTVAGLRFMEADGAVQCSVNKSILARSLLRQVSEVFPQILEPIASPLPLSF